MEPVTGALLIVGLGASGEAVARYLHRQDAGGAAVRVSVVDAADDPGLRLRADRLRACGADVRLGAVTVEGRYDLAVVSPGVPPHSSLFRSAAESSAEMVSEIEFAFRRSGAPWLAVTGTNGKTTVTSLLGHLLLWGGVSARTVGNIGTPAIDIVDEVGPGGALVAEVSSFQLALTDRFHPRVSVLLNITADHLDWHGDLETYAADKARIFARQGPDDVAVIDADDPGSAALIEPVRARGVRVVPVSLRERHPGGAWIDEDGMLVVERGSGALPLVPADELRIRGAHNVSNALAAAAAALWFGSSPDSVREGLRSFEPIEHRLEAVGTVGPAEYFNDSKATNPDAALKALSAFEGRPVVLLLGGRNKGNSFALLAETMERTGVNCVVFGEAADEIGEYLRKAGVSFEQASGLASAVEAAGRLASGHPGTAVLLSPACASFDEFADYGARGRAFKALVASQSGEVD